MGIIKSCTVLANNFRKMLIEGSIYFNRRVFRIRRHALGLLMFFILGASLSLEAAPNWTLEKIESSGIIEKCRKAQQLQNENLFVKARKIMDEIDDQLSESQFAGGGVRYTFELVVELDGRWIPSINERGLSLHRESKVACENSKTHKECAGAYLFSYYGSGADAEALEQAAHDRNFLTEVQITRVMQLSNDCKIEPSSVFTNSITLHRYQVSDEQFQKKSPSKKP